MDNEKIKEKVSNFLSEILELMKEMAENEEPISKLESKLYKKFKKLPSEVQSSLLVYLFLNSIEKESAEKDDLNPEVG